MKKISLQFISIMLLASCASGIEYNQDFEARTLADKKIHAMLEDFPAAPIKNSDAIKLINNLEAFVMRDMPFQMEHRMQNIDNLKDIIDSSSEFTKNFPTDQQRLRYLSKSQLNQFMDSPANEIVYQAIIGAYKKEVLYAKEINIYSQEINYNGIDTRGQITQYGRLALVWSATDGTVNSCFDMKEQRFFKITNELANKVKTNMSNSTLLKPENIPENWPCNYN